MNKILTFTFFLVFAIEGYSQSLLGYYDLATLFSENDNNGTSRYTAMSGAFGALGGDVSSLNVNPAGISVMKNSAISVTGSYRDAEVNSRYYNNSIKSQNEYFNLSQAGAIIVFDDINDSEWSRFAIGFNYRIMKDLNNSLFAQGNNYSTNFTEQSSIGKSVSEPYIHPGRQSFTNSYEGEISEITVAFSAVHQSKLHIGLGINFYNLNFFEKSQITTADEYYKGEKKDYLSIAPYKESQTEGNGFSANIGFIYKVNSFFRIGASYQTPTWYSDILESSYSPIYYYEDSYDYSVSDSDSDNKTKYKDYYEDYPYPEEPLDNLYDLRTPGKLTGSAALVFGKLGLISFDYTRRFYREIRLTSNSSVFSENDKTFQKYLRNTSTYNAGTEWRLGRFSLRGGYRYELNFSRTAIESDNLRGYSFGFGYNFGSVKLDFSYTDYRNTSIHDFYPESKSINPAELQNGNKRVFGTLTINL